MTAQQMYYNFRIELDKFASDVSITSDDIGYYLNKAMLDFIEKRFNGVNYTQRGFQQSPQMIAELRPLFITGVEIIPSYPGILLPDGFELDRAELPANTLYFVSATAELTYVEDPAHLETDMTGAVDVRAVVAGQDSATRYPILKDVQNDDVYQLLGDPFNKPSLTRVLMDINEDNLDLYTNDISFVGKAIINYIKEPLKVNFEGTGDQSNQDCELPGFTHPDIVDLAVRMFLNNENQQEAN